MRSIAVINQKGGVGKTTTVTNLGVALGARGLRVLLIDLDPQAHLTLHLGLVPEDGRPSVYEVLTSGRAVSEAIVRDCEGVSVLGSTIDLAAAEVELVSVVGREVILRDALGEVAGEYDIVMIDCPPSLGLLTLNALAAVDEVIIPLQPQFLALQGMGKLLETIALVSQRINSRLRVSGVLLSMYESNARLTGEVVADIEGFLERFREQRVPWREARIFRSLIRRNIRLAECPSYGSSVFRYAPTCPGAADYEALADELLALERGEARAAGAAAPVTKVNAAPVPSAAPAAAKASEAPAAKVRPAVTKAAVGAQEAKAPRVVKAAVAEKAAPAVMKTAARTAAKSVDAAVAAKPAEGNVEGAAGPTSGRGNGPARKEKALRSARAVSEAVEATREQPAA